MAEMQKRFQIRFLILCVLGLSFLARTSAKCQPKKDTEWIGRGCREDIKQDMMLLFSDRNPASEVDIDWNNWDSYMKDLACRCANEARSRGFQFFALEYYGECWGRQGPLQEVLSKYPKAPKEDDCVGHSFELCLAEQFPEAICVGRAHRAYFYEFANSTGFTNTSGGGSGGEGCKKPVDIALVLDASGSIDQNSWKKITQFLQAFVDRFEFPNSLTRFAIVRYDHTVYTDLKLEDSEVYSMYQLKEKITNLHHTQGATVTQLALKVVKDKIFKGPPRIGVARTCILLTDGRTFGGSKEVKEPAEALMRHHVHMIAIGIGDYVDTEELLTIAGKRKNVIQEPSFDQMVAKAHSIIDKLTRKACKNGA